MPIITLTTDWNRDDFYVGAVKGKIYSNSKDVKIVDITHQIVPFKITTAAFILKNSYLHFPKGSIHIIGINSEFNEKNHCLIIYSDGHYFIGADNGIFSLLLEEKPEIIIKLNTELSSSFPELSNFTKAACHIANKGDIKELGEEVNEFIRHTPILPTIEDSVISGSVIYIDSYKNAITNISVDLFKRICKNRSFEILVQSNHYRINKINKTYEETTTGELLAIFNSLDLLEIAINKGNAAELLNLTLSSSIRIKFFD